jgi:HSP20 family protein
MTEATNYNNHLKPANMNTLNRTPMGSFMLQPIWYNPFDKFFRNDFLSFWNGGIPETLPSVNIKNEMDHYKIELAAPGLRKEDFHVDLEKNILVISCEKENEIAEDKNGKFERREYNYSKFSRRVVLPENADADRITGKYVNGILILTIPKFTNGSGERNNRVKIE